MIECNGKCIDKELCPPPKPARTLGLGYYEVKGNKLCSKCEVKMNTPARYCPCCTTILRVVPKNKNKLKVMVLAR
jgi:hypothetical protein